MLSKRIIPCLDVKDNQVVKGIKFRDHQVVGDIVELAQYYCASGADELVFYDITASSDGRVVNTDWVNRVAKTLDIPFCVAGGIRTLKHAENILQAGADKISINSPALENPSFINQCVKQFGSQCVVIGIDSFEKDNQYYVYQYTGDEHKALNTNQLTKDWITEVQQRGAGEIVLNCMNQDGVRQGYDVNQLQLMRTLCQVPLIASGGAGNAAHFAEVFQQANVSGALAASIFHKKTISIQELKNYLINQKIEIRPC
jgi:imidazole glycerol-phosphate synthase subunit HisF